MFEAVLILIKRPLIDIGWTFSEGKLIQANSSHTDFPVFLLRINKIERFILKQRDGLYSSTSTSGKLKQQSWRKFSSLKVLLRYTIDLTVRIFWHLLLKADSFFNLEDDIETINQHFYPEILHWNNIFYFFFNCKFLLTIIRLL